MHAQFVNVLCVCPIRVSDKASKAPQRRFSIGTSKIIEPKPFHTDLFREKLAQNLSHGGELIRQEFSSLACVLGYGMQDSFSSLLRDFLVVYAAVPEGILKLVVQVLHRASHTYVRQEQSSNPLHQSESPKALST